MAKYLLLIYGDEQKWNDMTGEELAAHSKAHEAFRAAAGVRVLGTHELADSKTARTLRSDVGGRVVSTDGPFAETKEVLGGYYLLEAADIDEVAMLAELLPEVYAGHSAVEIRPIA
jgi:hypothetical protein